MRGISKTNPVFYFSTAFTSSILLGLLIASCSASPDMDIPEEIASLENLSVFPPDSEPEYDITLARETTYTDTGDVLLGGSLSAFVDDRDRVFVVDHQETAIHLYNPDGTYNRQIGREGEGPGEYRRIGTMQADGHALYLMDRNLNRITLFDLDSFDVLGDFSIPVDQENTGGHRRHAETFYLTGDDNYLIQFEMGFVAGQDMDTDDRRIEGKILDRKNGSHVGDEPLYSFRASDLLVHREGGSLAVMYVPYKRSSFIGWKNGQLIHGWNEHFLFKFFDKNGIYRRAIYYPYHNVALDRDEILKSYEDQEGQWRNMVRGDNMPETWPMYSSFYFDDEGRIWVGKITDDSDVLEYNVLANSGELLAVYTWPANRNIQQIRNGFLYTRETNEETELQEIVKYKVEFR